MKRNLTLRNNILFGNPFQESFYWEIIKACAMTRDLGILANGDQTELGENGSNVSGGQKQRIGLARAAYHNGDIVLLDDSLSAVDAHVGQHIFDNLIGPNGLLREKTRIFATHSLGFLDKVDRVVVMENGRILDLVCQLILI